MALAVRVTQGLKQQLPEIPPPGGFSFCTALLKYCQVEMHTMFCKSLLFHGSLGHI